MTFEGRPFKYISGLCPQTYVIKAAFAVYFCCVVVNAHAREMDRSSQELVLAFSKDEKFYESFNGRHLSHYTSNDLPSVSCNITLLS